MHILYNDQTLIIVNKPPSVPAQPDPTGDPSLLEMAQRIVGHPLFVVHRIDRPVSGAVVFAKTPQAAYALSTLFQQHQIQKRYLAIVPLLQGGPTSGTLVHFLSANNVQNKTQAYDFPKPGTKQASLSYRIHAQLERYSVLDIDLHSGRHHQIRVQLAAIGHAIKGDVKYGARRGNPDRSICLHAWKIAFEHPETGEWIEVTAPLPESEPLWNNL
jgi:23S rRNA pseudouridine1911/1915/1917 synthase